MPTLKTSIAIALIAWGTAALAAHTQAAEAARKPNIIFILADDLG